MRKIVLDKEMIDRMVVIYEQTHSSYETARTMGLSRSCVYRTLKRLHISMSWKTGPRNLIDIDEHFFSVIDTEEKAY